MEESASMEIQLATASINNEDQNTQNDELVIEIIEMVERPEIQSSKQCCIYKFLGVSLAQLEGNVKTSKAFCTGYHHDQDCVNARAKQIKTVNSTG
ncbi:hypothetical protein CFP56_034922 [Quercus suber]|uniref:Uncharacterized protein n=1 Tax=Quercus suber TaxID=58331 RepID=A0AAW0JD85_QUESU